MGRCEAIERPTAASLEQDHAQLRRDAIGIEGTITTYRSENAVPAALEEPWSVPDLPLLRTGRVWRSAERFRANYRAFHPPETPAGGVTMHSVAMDGDKAYQFSSSMTSDSGMLRVCEQGTDEWQTARAFAARAFLDPLDALWASSGVAYAETLQRPETQVVPNQLEALRGGYALLMSVDDDNQGRCELAPTKHQPFAFSRVFSSSGEQEIVARRRVFSQVVEGRLLPRRVVDVIEFNRAGKGYTQVVDLDLAVLGDNSPIAGELNSASFRDLSFGYQVYTFRESGVEELAERYR
ncbi:MAG TPA: hypothetical protein PKC18_03420 [Lacipirellulaceae bacterium]|nr:hypothetical protein [Lacipirellulaceae bacterium]HMP06970.1 hypothetical protein [Lacipirellulaceae bacterium]